MGPFAMIAVNLFGGIIAKRIASRMAAPVQKVTEKFEGSRTLVVANGWIILGLALAISSALGGIDWSAFIGPVWGGLMVSAFGIITAVLRVITKRPVK